MNFVWQSVVRTSPERLFAFHELPDALERLTPPWQEIKIIQMAKIREVGSRAIFDIKVLGPYSVRWVAEHTAYEPPRFFEDVQVEGPFKNWRHRHIIEPHNDGSILRDEVDYQPPFGWIGELGMKLVMANTFDKLFEFRHEITRRWCENDPWSRVRAPD